MEREELQNFTNQTKNEIIKDFTEQRSIVENMFYDYMTDNGYSVYIHDGNDRSLGYGGFAAKKDEFAIFFTLVEFQDPRSFSVNAEDRNGNFILIGDTAAIYTMSINDEDDLTINEIKDKFSKLLNDIYEKYGNYSKENRLDFVYNELKMERKDYSFECEKEIIEKVL